MLLLVGQCLRAQPVFTEWQRTFEFEGDLAVWDISGTYNDSVGGIDVSFTLDVDSKGKITGYGNVDAYMQGVDLWGDIVATGTITKSGTITRVSLNLKLVGTASYQGENHKFSATESVKAEVDPVARQLTGWAKAKINVEGQSQSAASDFQLDLMDIDGSWTVPVELNADAKGKITGSGSVLIEGAGSYNFAVTGAYSAKTSLATLTLKGADLDSKGISLKLTVTPEGVVKMVTGTLLGQKVAKK